jgi:hypothetical protein
MILELQNSFQEVHMTLSNNKIQNKIPNLTEYWITFNVLLYKCDIRGILVKMKG